MRKILIYLLPFLFLGSSFSEAKQFKVSGIVADEHGIPLAEASITVKGFNTGTLSGKDGRYEIMVEDNNAILVFSAVGFLTKEEKVKGRKSISVKLQSASTALQEVLVTGISVQRKERILQSQRAQAKSYPTTPGFYPDRNYVDHNTEDYDHINDNRFVKTKDNPLSTFSIDVDAASYSNIRRFISRGELPPAGAIRIEEMINYFKYDYPQPTGEHPFSFHTEMSDAPWNPKHKLVMIGMQGKEIATENLPPSNLVFLIDVSGSMQDPLKLPLVKASMKMLADQLRENDRVSIVVYAGAAGLVLPPTNGNDKLKIKNAIDELEAGGSTAGGAGIQLAYKTAREYFVKNGNNRVILCTDGDFNVGASSDDAMERLIEEERKSGVFLTVLGFGMGNYKDNKMQKIADKGNGNHAYIDGMDEARKVLVNEFGGTLFTIAKDVKLQVEFNPAHVQGYRLIGYENRMLNKEDFNNDKKDAGEMGSGHTVTALYEIIPTGVKSEWLEEVDPLKYQQNSKIVKSAGNEVMTIKFRYKKAGEDNSKLIIHAVKDNQIALNKTSDNFRFAAAVAEWGMILRQPEFKSGSSYSQVIQLAKEARGKDEEGYRKEFIRMVENAASIAKNDNDEEKTKRGSE